MCGKLKKTLLQGCCNKVIHHLIDFSNLVFRILSHLSCLLKITLRNHGCITPELTTDNYSIDSSIDFCIKGHACI